MSPSRKDWTVAALSSVCPPELSSGLPISLPSPPSYSLRLSAGDVCAACQRAITRVGCLPLSGLLYYPPAQLIALSDAQGEGKKRAWL